MINFYLHRNIRSRKDSFHISFWLPFKILWLVECLNVILLCETYVTIRHW